jgi:hypothetical protein
MARFPQTTVFSRNAALNFAVFDEKLAQPVRATSIPEDLHD